MAIDSKILEKYKGDLIRKGNDPKTGTLYSKWLRDICEYFDIEDPLTLNFEEVKEFIEHTIKKRPANTVNTAFHSFIYYYNKLNKKNFPFDIIKRPKRERNTEVEIFTTEEIKKLLESTERPKHRTALMLMYSCGLDIGELTQILISDINSSKTLYQ